MRVSTRSMVLAAVLAGGCAEGYSQMGGSQYGSYGGTAVAPAQVVHGNAIPPGTQLSVQLEQPLGTGVSRPGERFSTRVLSPVLDGSGQAIIPAGAQITGFVADLQPGSRFSGDRPAYVALEFDQLRFGAVAHPINARVLSTQVDTSRRVSGRGVAAGAIGGAVLGRVLGGSTATAIAGGALGAGAGSLISLGAGGGQARLPEGSAMTIEIQSPIPFAALRGFGEPGFGGAYGGGPYYR